MISMSGLNGSYAETAVKKKVTVGMQLGKIALIILGILLIFGGLFLHLTLISILGVVEVVALFFILPMFDITYEYIFCDGQIDFDKITGGEKRKTVIRIDMDNVEIMAPVNSHELDSYRNLQDIRHKDFSSGEDGAKLFCIYYAKGTDRYLITFEPSDTMVECARQKSPRKVVLY